MPVFARIGSSSSISRLAGAPPRTSPEAVVASSNSSTVQPVCSPVQWPTRTPKSASGQSTVTRPKPARRIR